MPPRRRRREPVRGGGPWRRRPRAQPCLAALHPQSEPGPFSDAHAGAEEGYAGAGGEPALPGAPRRLRTRT